MQEAMPGSGRLVRVRTVRGEPYEVRERRLIPLARLVSLGRARATIGTHRLEGRGWGLAYVKPLGVLVETRGGVRLARVAVRDGTARALVRMYLAAVALSLLFAAVRRLAQGWGPAGQA